ncbi:MAG: hypothetical protein IKZ86_06545 [Spirochaetaceae bacterium]|nr:hypothetical protein [Spirochaetaceae bacterium]
MKNKKQTPAVYKRKQNNVLYSLLTLFLIAGITTLLVLHFTKIIETFDMESVYLIALLVIIVLLLLFFPNIKEFSLGGIAFKTDAKESIKEADPSQEYIDDEKMPDKINTKEIKKQMLAKFLDQNETGLNESDFRQDMQIVSESDSINTYSPIFTWYTDKDSRKIFYEAKFTDITSTYHNKLYVMLSKIMRYNEQNDEDAKLILILLEKDYRCGVEKEHISNLKNVFRPALKNNLLEIATIRIDESPKT